MIVKFAEDRERRLCRAMAYGDVRDELAAEDRPRSPAAREGLLRLHTFDSRDEQSRRTFACQAESRDFQRKLR